MARRAMPPLPLTCNWHQRGKCASCISIPRHGASSQVRSDRICLLREAFKRNRAVAPGRCIFAAGITTAWCGSCLRTPCNSALPPLLGDEFAQGAVSVDRQAANLHLYGMARNPAYSRALA